MGKKSKKGKDTSKRVSTPPDHKELSKAAKKEVTELVTKLLDMCSKPIAPGPKEIESHEDVYSLVEKIRNIQTDVSFHHPQREANFPAFLSWLNENKVDTSVVEVANFPDVGYGLKATKDLQESDSFLNIPRKVMMTTVTAKESALGALMAEDKILQAMPSIVLALHLLCERRSPDSFWRPYLDVLPERYTTPLYFSADDMTWLKGSPALKECVNQYRNIARQYAYFYKLLHSHPAASKLPIKDNFTYDDYRWAVSSVMTRQNQIPTPEGERVSFALIPMWDMCNHCNGMITTDFNIELDCSECYALREFKQGEQICIFYGARSNAELLIHSGFVYPENELDRTAIQLGISKSDPLYEKKAELLTRFGLAISRTFFIHRGNFPVDPQTLAFLRVFCLTEVNMDIVQVGLLHHQFVHHLDTLNNLMSREDFEEVIERLGDLDCPISSENEDKVWSFMETRLTLLLKAYSTTTEEDKQLLDSSDLNENRKLLVQLRLCEKNILNFAVEFVKSQKLSLTNEYSEPETK